ncbi:TfoX/Sxy family protein [Williamsia sterculiae]|uniref:TfoX N-terminal domain-containing protein n=1 Tax=Williamsia sterculiae TaxID=1344003 RepID=A0A1N7FGW4_9NOCA|nr:TfoX/Sxy family protein [Williamsia sterculiae]SIR99524.1 TfoX N-terminal domain-containing protein [Williamsia sterculiae]
MAYDAALADRIRDLMETEGVVTEKRMFGGLAFLVQGHMAVAASGNGGLMTRVAPDDTDALLVLPHVQPMVMSGRQARGWVRVTAEGIGTDEQLQEWIDRAADVVRTLPPKS